MKHFINFILSIIAVVVFGSCGERNKLTENNEPATQQAGTESTYKTLYKYESIVSDDTKRILKFEILKYEDYYSYKSYSFQLDFEKQIFISKFLNKLPNVIIENEMPFDCIKSIDSVCTKYEFKSTVFDFLPIQLEIGKMETLQIESNVKKIKSVYNMNFPFNLYFPVFKFTNIFYIFNEGLFIPSESHDPFPELELIILPEFGLYDNHNKQIFLSNIFSLSAQIDNFQSFHLSNREFSLVSDSELKITGTFKHNFTDEEEKRSWILKFIF